ncbi:hypothetical protein T8K17_23520 [Thalassobaculum sp. OXR-137]|uniref:hypothetical protein n=1 Tax=Thalassobaculum sp. OXR-137 TaxID=3100173 RepID=UPI002AC9D076|nr:hypothetical protein [Thalassobaculum sp. OXR-137]WPZ34189.1 hypothetical protein T8K17_23520 [Thalassobaculum sp. OXR-137]
MAKPRQKPKPFMFDYSFDDGADEARLAAERAARRAAEEAEANKPPTFTVEELEAAKAEAYARGRQDGMDDAMAGIEQQIARTLDAVFSRISKVFQQHAEWTKEMETDAARLGIAVIGRLAPELVRDRELPEVEAVIRDAFGFLTEQPKVMIRVAKDLEESLSGKVELMASRVGYEGQVVLVGDPELPVDDCRISWQAGAVERSLDDVWGQIEQITERVLAGAPKRKKTEAAEAAPAAAMPPVDSAEDEAADMTDETGETDPQSIPA